MSDVRCPTSASTQPKRTRGRDPVDLGDGDLRLGQGDLPVAGTFAFVKLSSCQAVKRLGWFNLRQDRRRHAITGTSRDVSVTDTMGRPLPGMVSKARRFPPEPRNVLEEMGRL